MCLPIDTITLEKDKKKRNFFNFINKEDKQLLIETFYLAVFIRLTLFIVGYIVEMAIPKLNAPIMQTISQLYYKWDARAFLYLAQYGYTNYGDQSTYLAYFPFYPAMVNIFSYISGTYMAASLIVSGLASVIAGFFLQKLVMMDSDKSESKRALWLFYFFPTAYFLAAPYSEALFICLVLASLFCARNKKWFLASILAALVGATRLQGLVIIPTLMIEFWMQRKETSYKKLLYLLITPLGFAAYLFINWYMTGNAFEFLKIQREHFYHTNILPTQQIWETIKHITNDVPSEMKVLLHEAKMISIIFSVAILAYSFKWMRVSYQFFAWSQLIILLTDSWLMSLPRYLLAIFPFYIILAKLTEKPERYQFVLTFSIMLMMGMYSLFAAGNWAF